MLTLFAAVLPCKSESGLVKQSLFCVVDRDMAGIKRSRTGVQAMFKVVNAGGRSEDIAYCGCEEKESHTGYLGGVSLSARWVYSVVDCKIKLNEIVPLSRKTSNGLTVMSLFVPSNACNVQRALTRLHLAGEL